MAFHAVRLWLWCTLVQSLHITHLRQQWNDSKFVIFQEKRLKVLKCCNSLWVQQRYNCSPVASFANCVMTLYLLKVHLQTFLSIPVTQKCQILSCDTCHKWAICRMHSGAFGSLVRSWCQLYFNSHSGFFMSQRGYLWLGLIGWSWETCWSY